MKIEGVIFDMDGTITDSEIYSRKLFLSAMAERGFPTDEHFYSLIIGANRVSGIKKISEITKDDNISIEILDSLIVLMDEAFRNNRIRLKKGVAEIISFLRFHNIPMALATSANMAKVIKSFSSNNMEVPFSHIITGDRVKHGKPNPEIFIRAAKMLNADIKNCVVIEDSYLGLQAALASQAVTIMVPDLQPPTEQLISQGVIVKKDLLEVLEFLKQYVTL
ncbi:MAG TPA: HAD family phosphatase [Erysipelotrichaceae bacterium]|nr:HAD family phosphatase [Erysipelotrichaceae bacterium]